MRGTSKHKVVSSGRLSGGGRAQPGRKRVSGGQPVMTLLSAEPAYSLYSTDSENQVTTIHKGLDRCAALLNGILQAEKADTKPSVSRAVKSGAAKPRSSSSAVKERDSDRKKHSKKTVRKTANPQNGPRCVQSTSVDPGPGVNRQSAPRNPAQGRKPQSGPAVLFNGRLTTSTPTPSPDRPPANTLRSSASTPTTQRQASSAEADEPPALIPPQPPSLPPSSPPSLLPSLPRSLPHPGSSVSGLSSPAPQGNSVVSYPPIGAAAADRPTWSAPLPGSQASVAPSVFCSCSVRLCQLHAPLIQALAQNKTGSTDPTQPQTRVPPQSQIQLQSHTLSQPQTQPQTQLSPSQMSDSLGQPQHHSEPDPPKPEPSPQTIYQTSNPTLSLHPSLPLPPSLPLSLTQSLPLVPFIFLSDTYPPEAGTGVEESPGSCPQDPEPSAGEDCGHRGHGPRGEEEREERVPVRDIGAQASFDKHTHTTAEGRHAHSHTHNKDTHSPEQRNTAAKPTHSTQSEPGQVDTHSPDTHKAQSVNREDCSEDKVKRVQNLLRELKTLLTGPGGESERLLWDVEEIIVSVLPALVDSRNLQAEMALVLQPLRKDNSLLCRRVRILNQQLAERERSERDSRRLHTGPEVSSLQAELSEAQSQLRQLQGDIIELQQALQDTQSHLRACEAENICIKTDLEVTSSRLLELQREKTELSLLAHQRLEEIHTYRLLQDPVPSLLVIDSYVSRPPLTKQALHQYQLRQDPSEPDPVSQYLSSLGQNGRVPASPPCKGPPSHSNTHPDHRESGCEIGGESMFVRTEDDVCVHACVERGVYVSEQEASVCAIQKQAMSSLPAVRSHQGGGALPTSTTNTQNLDMVFKLLHQSKRLVAAHLDQSDCLSPEPTPPSLTQPAHRRLEMGRGLSIDSFPSQCEVRSVTSDWSVGTGSTFDTRHEEEFKNGLAALDASIASLQRTIHTDLGR